MVKILLMGVSGSGKTHIGKCLAVRLNAHWIDGDDYHSKECIALMRAGIPLSDEQRAPWLKKLAFLLSQNKNIVMACSALREQYRKQLLLKAPGCLVVWLDPPEEVLQKRLSQRSDHFFSATLLISQLETLEPPISAVRIDSSRPDKDVMEEILRYASSLD